MYHSTLGSILRNKEERRRKKCRVHVRERALGDVLERPVLGLGLRVWGFGFGVQGCGFRVSGLEFSRVEGRGLRV